jgi:hypothetical protein
MQERLAWGWGVLAGGEVHLDRPGLHHEVCVVPLDDLQPERFVVTGGPAKVGAVQKRNRRGSKFPPGALSRA